MSSTEVTTQLRALQPRQFYVAHGKDSDGETTTTTATDTTQLIIEEEPSSSSSSTNATRAEATNPPPPQEETAALEETEATMAATTAATTMSTTISTIAATAKPPTIDNGDSALSKQPPQIDHIETNHKNPQSTTTTNQAYPQPSRVNSKLRSINKNQVSTSYSLFSTNPNRFILDHIHTATHYLTDKIEGRIWLDVNGDGKRGRDSSASTISNEMDIEDDNWGIGGVQVQLINCLTDEPVTNSITNSPNNPFANPITSQPRPIAGGIPVVKESENESAGLFSFPIDQVESGRYYLMYTAPRDYRISGNALPLERNEPYFDCVPSGGEGDSYLQKARKSGDFDIPGYCARSIGCFEVDRILHAHEKSNFDDYSKLQVLEDSQVLKDQMTQGYQTYMGTLSAVPFAEYFNVVLAQEEWELPTYQYADLEVTLAVPPTADLEHVVPQNFEESDVRRQLEQGLTSFLTSSARAYEFEVKGVDLHSGKIESLEGEHKKKTVSGSSLRGGERRALRGSEEPYNRVIYTLTARGHYRPPPYQQLGSVIEDSINSNRQEVAKTLEEVEALPEEILAEDVYAKWLTMKEKVEAAPIKIIEEVDDGFVFLGSWAFILVITLVGCAICILLACFCLYRRARVAKPVAEITAVCQTVTDVNFMSVPKMLREMKIYGASTANIAGRQNLEKALIKARKEYARRIQGKRRVNFSLSTIFSSLTSSLSNSNNTGNTKSTFASSAEFCREEFNKQERIEETIASCEYLTVVELIQMLQALGVSASGIADKKALARLLAEARVNGANGVNNDPAAGATIGATVDHYAQREAHPPTQQRLRTRGARTGQRRGSAPPLNRGENPQQGDDCRRRSLSSFPQRPLPPVENSNARATAAAPYPAPSSRPRAAGGYHRTSSASPPYSEVQMNNRERVYQGTRRRSEEYPGSRPPFDGQLRRPRRSSSTTRRRPDDYPDSRPPFDQPQQLQRPSSRNSMRNSITRRQPEEPPGVPMMLEQQQQRHQRYANPITRRRSERPRTKRRPDPRTRRRSEEYLVAPQFEGLQRNGAGSNRRLSQSYNNGALGNNQRFSQSCGDSAFGNESSFVDLLFGDDFNVV